ncbi:hypothetical protein [Chryseobacterium sp.]|uniref:hypothetical protein n=1 Tax=Chryseobacterium sp. TaxID=1871047 RepID=UPI00321AF63D
MIQFILMLLGLAFPNNNANATVSDVTIVTTQNSFTNSSEVVEDTSGETGQILPPKK